MSLATAGWESGQGQCGHAVGDQSIDVLGPVDSVPQLSFQEWKSCRTSGLPQQIPWAFMRDGVGRFLSQCENAHELGDSSFSIRPGQEKRLSSGLSRHVKLSTATEHSKCNDT
jgi:hypothetical protein